MIHPSALRAWKRTPAYGLIRARFDYRKVLLIRLSRAKIGGQTPVDVVDGTWAIPVVREHLVW